MIARATIFLSALVSVAAPALAAEDGHRLFVQSCAVCHMKPSPVASRFSGIPFGSFHTPVTNVGAPFTGVLRTVTVSQL